MQSFLVFIILVIAAIFVGWKLYGSLTKTQQDGCGCSCSGCDSQETRTNNNCSQDTLSD